MMRYLLLVILLLPLTVFAQDTIDLVPGDTVRIDVTVDTRGDAVFTIEDEPVFVRVQAESESDDFDTVIWIVDSENRMIAYNDNFAGSQDSRIDNLYLVPDSYRLVVDSFNGVSEGEVIFSLDIVDPFDVEMDETENGITLRAYLPEDTLFTYDVAVNENDVLDITVRDVSGTLDTYLAIYDESGQLLIANDDHQSTDLNLNRLDSRIPDWIVPSNGIYTISVHDFSGQAGWFEVVIAISS